MASIINASSTGSGGIVQTADASGVLQLQSNGTVALTVNADASVSLALAPSVNITMATTTTYQTDLTLQAQPASGTTGTSSAGGVQILFKGTTDGAIANSTLAAVVGFVQTTSVNNAGGLAIRCQESAGSGLVDSARFSASGLIALRGATNVTSGSGISFPATQSATSDANTLDDYEEGTFTPSVTFGGNAVGITYNSRLGRYTKIGNCVTFNLYLQMSSKGSSTGTFNIIGLPFTSQNVSVGYNTFTLWTNNTPVALSGIVQGYVTQNSTAVTFEFQASGFYGAMGAITNTQCNNNTDFMVGGMYFV